VYKVEKHTFDQKKDTKYRGLTGPLKTDQAFVSKVLAMAWIQLRIESLEKLGQKNYFYLMQYIIS
jgi:hypothetical protein